MIQDSLYNLIKKYKFNVISFRDMPPHSQWYIDIKKRDAVYKINYSEKILTFSQKIINNDYQIIEKFIFNKSSIENNNIQLEILDKWLSNLS